MSRPRRESAIDLASPGALLRLATGYRVSQAVYVATRLRLADMLADCPKSADELAHDTETHALSLRRLLRMLAAYGVVVEDEIDRFALTPLGACLRADAPNSVRDHVLMAGSKDFWQDWSDLSHCVTTGEFAASHLHGVANAFDYYTQHPEIGAMMNAGFASSARIVAHAVAAAYDFSGAGTIVDVAGGQGRLLATILRGTPAARGVLCDLPAVVAGAAPLLAAEGVADRCTVVAGDIFAEVPQGGDVYLLSRIIHDWDDARALTILRNCRLAMRPEATLLLVEVVLPDRLEPSTLAQEQTLHDLNMLVRTGGKERTKDEYRALLGAAGFALA
jgi:hypothetical protein